MGTFIVHNIRALRINDVFENKGLAAAQKLGKHAKPSTTLKYYVLDA